MLNLFNGLLQGETNIVISSRAIGGAGIGTSRIGWRVASIADALFAKELLAVEQSFSLELAHPSPEGSFQGQLP